MHHSERRSENEIKLLKQVNEFCSRFAKEILMRNVKLLTLRIVSRLLKMNVRLLRRKIASQ